MRQENIKCKILEGGECSIEKPCNNCKRKQKGGFLQ